VKRVLLAPHRKGRAAANAADREKLAFKRSAVEGNLTRQT
jgi:hypothetical protein